MTRKNYEIIGTNVASYTGTTRTASYLATDLTASYLIIRKSTEFGVKHTSY